MQRRLLIVRLADIMVELEKLGPRAEYVVSNQFVSDGLLMEDLMRRGINHEEINRTQREIATSGKAEISF